MPDHISFGNVTEDRGKTMRPEVALFCLPVKKTMLQSKETEQRGSLRGQGPPQIG